MNIEQIVELISKLDADYQIVIEGDKITLSSINTQPINPYDNLTNASYSQVITDLKTYFEITDNVDDITSIKDLITNHSTLGLINVLKKALTQYNEVEILNNGEVYQNFVGLRMKDFYKNQLYRTSRLKGDKQGVTDFEFLTMVCQYVDITSNKDDIVNAVDLLSAIPDEISIKGGEEGFINRLLRVASLTNEVTYTAYSRGGNIFNGVSGIKLKTLTA